MSGNSYSRIGFQVGVDWRVDCYTYADATPIFDLGAGSSSVAISLRGQKSVDKTAVEFAQALAAEAQKFAAEVERIHAVQLADDGGTDKAAGDSAA